MPELPSIGAELAGYRIESRLSRGGMAVVYLAEDLRMRRRVALKILSLELADDDSFRERFLRESRMAASIDHPNIIPVHDAGEADGLLYISMRYVEGPDLRGLLRAEENLDIERSTSIILQAASGLEAAHRRGLIHRDVKPANILIVARPSAEATDHIYLSDFGLAKHTGSVSGLTATGQFMGTVNYVAPEQIEGRGVDNRTDIYALGCVLFECLTGSPPFKRYDDLATIMAHIKDEPPRVSDLRPGTPPALDEVVSRTLAKSPQERYASCQEVMVALRRATAAPSRPEISVTRGPAEAVAAEAPVGAPPRDGGTADGDGGAAGGNGGGAAGPPGRAEDSVPAAEPAGAGAQAGAPGAARLPRRLVWPLLAALAGVIALGAFLLSRGGEHPSRPTVIAGRTGLHWQAVPASPTARQQVATAVAGGRLWVIGGLTDRGATAKVEAYDPRTGSWTAGPDLPVPLHHAMAATYRGELVVMGGWIPRGANVTAVTSDRMFALRHGAWVRLANLNHRRAAGTAAAVGDRIVVAGGQVAGRLIKSTEVFDGRRWKDVADIPTPREHLAGASDGRFVYAAGGRQLSAARNSAALERYDPATDHWTRLPDMPLASGSIGAAIALGHLVVVGGEDPTKVIGAVQSFDLKTGSWSSLPGLPVPRHGMAVAAIGNWVYALDGAEAPTHARSTNQGTGLDLASAYAAPPAVRHWRSVHDSPTPRQQVAAAVANGRIWVVGGLSDDSATTKTEAYDPAIDTWTAAPDLPVPLHHAMATTYRGELVVIGGWVPRGSNLTATTSDQVFALRNGAWVRLPKLNHARAAGAAAAVGDKLVLVGGQANGRLVKPTEVFDGKRWTDAADVPTPREHLAAVSDGRFVYAVGGRALSADKNSAALQRYDPAANRWAQLPSMPIASGSIGAAIVRGHLVVVGGEAPTKVIDAVQSFDLKTDRWSTLPPMRTPRHGMAVVGVGNTLYALDGAQAPGHSQSTNQAEALDFV